MATAAGVSLEVRDVGSAVTVPNDDVARLMYYLNCVTVGCGLDIIQDDLVDYRRYYRLSTSRADSVFALALTFSPDEVINKVIYLDDGSLCGSSSNKFFEISSATQLLSIQSEFVLAGQTQSVQKIMVFTPGWLESFYIDPLKRNISRLERITGQDTLHCSHCKGQSGRCSCTSCPRTSRSQCRPSTRNLLLGALVEAISEISVADKFEEDHCDHCKGRASPCVCESGCAVKPSSKCTAQHGSVRCDACSESPIQGARFTCMNCRDYDLCRSCYVSEKHILTHTFQRIDRNGSQPVTLPPRRKPAPPRPDTRYQRQSSSPGSAHSSTSGSGGGYFYLNMSAGELKEYIKSRGESLNNAIEVEDLRQRAWECHCDSMAIDELNTFLNGKNISWEGCSISQRRDKAKAAFFRASRPVEPKRQEISTGRIAVLKGLQAVNMNGRRVKIVNPEAVPGRAEVMTLDDFKSFKVKHENLQFEDDFLD